jgi:multiple sugar transport system permease protein
MRRRSWVLAGFVALPLLAAAAGGAWRVGAAHRDAAVRHDIGRAVALVDSLTAQAARSRPTGAAATGGRPEARLTRMADALAQRPPAGYQVAVYRLAPDSSLRRMDDEAAATRALRRPPGASAREIAGPAAALPASLLPAVGRRLALHDRALAQHAARRTLAVAPVKDADDWNLIGALVLRPTAAPPPVIPPRTLLAGLLAWLVAVAATWRFAGARRRGERLATVFVVLVAFGVYVADVVAAGGGLAALVLLGTAGASSLVGLSLAGIAEQRMRMRQALHAWGFLAPSLTHLLLFSIGPILFAFYLSFHRWNLVEAQRPFVGLANYRALLGDAAFGHALVNTAIYVLFVPVGMAVALGLALLVNRRMRGLRLLRTVFFLPYITSFVAISLVWKWMYDPDFGLFNNILGRLGLPAQPWLSSPATAMPSLMLMSVWMYAGYMMVIFLAGLQNIPESLYESARIDGAGTWQRFRRITLPMLRPTTFFVLVTMVIFMFQVFTAVYVMTEGGPLHATDVIVYHIYRNAWEYLRMGYASAMAWVLFGIVFVITLVQYFWLGGRVEHGQ